VIEVFSVKSEFKDKNSKTLSLGKYEGDVFNMLANSKLTHGVEIFNRG